MKGKNLVLINGIVGLVGGIFLVLAVFMFAGSIANDISRSISSNSLTTSATDMVSIAVLIVKLVVIGFGVYGYVMFKGDNRINLAPHILLIVGGAVALIPYLGWAGGIVAIVGGAIYLSKLKNFDN
ncbi:MAG: hypothetical protein PUI85_04120 [Eubacteriales bacterium]|nr:hypothetical protein [Eubacteriales bacterium]MDY3332344.1 hypothetical protein [Gallibacter sp.]